MKAFFVRHGDKKKGDFFNSSLRHQDEPLSSEGISKAKQLHFYFKDIDIQRIYVSLYVRTQQTARCIAGNPLIEIIKDRRLNEIDNGLIDSMSNEEIKQNFPQFYQDFCSFSMDVRFPEGETGAEVQARQKEFLDMLIRNDQTSLVICHEGYMRLLACHLLDMPVYKRNLFQIDTCGIMEIEYQPQAKTWRIIRINQTANI